MPYFSLSFSSLSAFRIGHMQSLVLESSLRNSSGKIIDTCQEAEAWVPLWHLGVQK